MLSTGHTSFSLNLPSNFSNQAAHEIMLRELFFYGNNTEGIFKSVVFAFAIYLYFIVLPTMWFRNIIFELSWDYSRPRRVECNIAYLDPCS